MRKLRIQYSIFIILAFLSIMSVGFATWSLLDNNKSEITGEIKVCDIKQVNDFVNLNTSEYKENAIEKIYYTSDGFTQNDSTSDKKQIQEMSYYVIDTADFTLASYIEVCFSFKDKLGNLLSSSDYNIIANLYDNNKNSIGTPIVVNNESTISVIIHSTTTTQGFGDKYYISLQLNMKVDNFDSMWYPLLTTNSVKLEISTTIKSDISNYWLITFIASINTSESQYVDLSWDYTSAFTYDKMEKTVLINDIPEDITVNYNENKKTDAGKYTAQATFTYGKKYIVRVNNVVVNNNSSCSISWIINPKVIALSNYLDVDSAYSIDYSSIKNWNNFKELISSILFNEEGFTDYNLYGISDGTFLYADTSKDTLIKDKLNALGFTNFKTQYNYVPGSTYLGYVELNNSNYVLGGQDYIYIKYKTAKIGDNNYYTIEDAINSTGNGSITMVGNLTTKENEVQITAFSRILSNSNNQITYTNNNHDIIVPYTSGNTSTGYSQKGALEPSSNQTCACLFIPEKINVIFEKSLYLTSVISGLGLVGDYGSIINNGTLTFNSGTLTSYGFLKGNGNIIIKSGVTVTDVMAFYDYPGGADKTATLSKTCFPIFAWVLNNISCKIKYMKGSTLKGLATIWGKNVKYNEAIIDIIGANNSASNCLFTPSSNSSSEDFIEKYSNSINCNNSFTFDNQEKNISNIEINGNYEDKTLTVSVTALLVFKFDFSTSQTKPLPMSYINISIKTGKLIINNASYIFLQGTKLIVDETAELVINGNSYILLDKSGSEALCSFFNKDYAVSKTNAILENNGTISGTGSIAGTIETTKTNAKLKINNYSIASTKVAYKTAKDAGTTNSNKLTSQYKKYDVNQGTIDNVYTIVNGGEYNSIEANGYYGWVANKATISFDSNGGSPDYQSSTVDISSSGYTIQASDIPTTTPIKGHYEFIGWSLNGENPIGQTIYSGVTIIANYKAIDYTIVFNDVNGGSDLTTNWNNGNTFNYETNITLNDPERGNLVFGGWYLDEALNNKVSVLKGASLVAYLNNNILNLYASWYSSDSDSYTIIYDNSLSNGTVCQENDKIIVSDGFDWSTVSLPIMTANDDNYNIKQYFDGWYNGNEKVTAITVDMFDENKELHLKAIYKDKNKLEIKYGNLDLLTVYYKSGYSFKIPDLSSYPELSIPSGYVFVRWILSDGTNENYYQAGDTVTLTNQTTLEPDIRQYVDFNIGNNDYTTVTVTLIKDAGYIVVDNNGTITITPFNGETKTNGASFLVTVGSKFNASYKGQADDSKATISGTTPTTDLSTTDTTYTVTGAVSITPAGTSCIIEGTLITLADGIKKKVEDLTPNDVLLVFNHETGTYDFAKINFIDADPYANYTIVNLKFSNGSLIKVISEHGFFDLDLMKYVYIDEFNYKDYVNHRFYSATWDGKVYQSNVVTLDEAYITQEYTRCYSPVTIYHLNYFTEDLLSMPGGISGLFNIFEYDNDLKYNSEKMQLDIETYGLFTYEDFKDKVPYEVYMAFPTKYFKVAIAKGILTEQLIEYYIKRYLPLMKN